MRALLIALLIAAAPGLAQETPAPVAPAEVAREAIDGYIYPSHVRFSEVTSDLEFAVDRLCETPTAAALAEAREYFSSAVGGFSRIAFLRFGPLMSNNRMERLLLWPDPRGIALKQVQAVLAEEPQDVLDPDALQLKSVALQGFNALEFVLFGTGGDELATAAGAYRCGYASAISIAIRRVAEDLEMEWSSVGTIAGRLTTPNAADPDYRSVREVLEELVGAMAHGAEGVRDTMLLPALGRDGGKPNPRSAPLWRSNSTLELAAGELIGITDMIRASGITEVAGEQGPFIADTIALEAENIRRTQTEVTGTMEEALGDRRQMQSLRYLVIYTQQMQSLIGEHLAQALGLSVGFSALDGD
jgi:predicted lipoprotein